MNRKHNPIVALVALALLTVLLLCAGCNSTTEAAEPETSQRFSVEAMTTNERFMWAYIITDTETGVQYLFTAKDDAGGLTVLQPATDEEEDIK